MPLSKDGKVYKVKGKEVVLYPISTLAEKLGKALKDTRTTQTVRKWETKGILPPATFRVVGKRLYAEEQIKAICRVAKECKIKQGSSLALTNFSERVREELREVNKKLLDIKED